MDVQTQALLKKSAEDEQTLSIAAVSDSIAAFHAQQAMEKLLKALLAELGIDYPKTHDLNRLRAQLEAAGEEFPSLALDLAEFTPFATVWRYDDPPEEAILDRSKAIDTVRHLRAFVHRRLKELERQDGPP
jgi:HEPN domain-containing protein